MSNEMVFELTSIYLISLVVWSVSAEFTCPFQKKDFADVRNAIWYPMNCSTHVQPRRSRCYLMCKDGFIFKQNASMFVDCIETEHSAYWSSAILDSCASTTLCPRIQSNLTFETTKGISCNKNPMAIGMTCMLLNGQCPINRLVGPTTLICRENGTWSGGGTYCKAKSLPESIKCPNTLIVSTDPHQPNVDARRILQKPILENLNPSQVTSSNITKLSPGEHRIFFNASGSHEEHSCNVLLAVQDRERPRPLICVEEQEKVISGRAGATVYIPQGVYQFIDNTGNVTSKFQSIYKSNEMFTAGVFKVSYTAMDSHGNQMSCKTTYTVHETQCVEKYPALNINITHYSTVGSYSATCKSAEYKSYTDRNVLVPFQKDFMFVSPLRNCEESNNFLKMPPFPDCYKIQNKTTGFGCVKGSVMSNSGNECIPCPRGFKYNVHPTLGALCELCPDNMTTFEQGSESCVACPGDSWASGQAPRRCKAHCGAGSIYTSIANCTKCDVTDPTCKPACQQGTKMGCQSCPVGFYAGIGDKNCSSCPQNMVTLVGKASGVDDCVWGKIISSSGNDTKSVKTTKKHYYMIFNVSTLPTNQLKQRYAVKVTSKYLSAQTDCENNYVQFKGIFEGFTTNLSDKLCGDQLRQTHVIKMRLWRQNFIEYAFTDLLKSDLQLNYGLASCDPGQYFNFSTNYCEQCPPSTYEDKHGSVECKQCPVNYTTYLPGQSYCMAMCPPGFKSNGMDCEPCPMNFYGKDGKCFPCTSGTATEGPQSSSCNQSCSSGNYLDETMCSQCPFGQYQPLAVHSQKQCRFCRPGTSTLFTGSTSSDECIKICHYEGEYYDTLSNMCKPCPVGTYKYASSLTMQPCIDCGVNMTTNSTGSVRQSDCKRNTPITNHCALNDPCLFPGRCQSTESGPVCVCPRYFTGVKCDIVSGPCGSTPCQNNGTCHAVFNSDVNFVCQCEPGYAGVNCEREVHKCDDNPCFKSNCTRLGQDFSCSCPPYTTGKTCRTALLRPCDNKTVCVNGICDDNAQKVGMNNYTCTCNEGYEGSACDRVIQYCANKPCDTNGTTECKLRRLGRDCICKPGFYGETCDKFRYCPAGSFVFRKQCCVCWQGYYSSKENINKECEKCPHGTTSLLRGTVNKSDCKEYKNLSKVKVKILIEGTDYQGNIDKTTCGKFQEHMENELLAGIGQFDSLKAVVIEGQHPPPEGKTGMILEFIIYGSSEDLKKQVKTKVKSGHFGSLTVDEDYLSFEDVVDVETKKQKNVVVYIIVVVVVLLLIALVAALYIWKCKNKTGHEEIMFNRNDEVVHISTPLRS